MSDHDKACETVLLPFDAIRSCGCAHRAEIHRLTREVESIKEFLAVESKAREGREALLRENCGDAPAPLGWFDRVRAALARAGGEQT